MTELTVGQRVKVRPKVGQVQEGIVYTHDSLTNTVTIREDVPSSSAHCTVFVFNRAHVEIDVLSKAGILDDHSTLPIIR